MAKDFSMQKMPFKYFLITLEYMEIPVDNDLSIYQIFIRHSVVTLVMTFLKETPRSHI